MATASPKQTWTIGELAREFGVTTRTIRFYEDEGLLSPLRRGTARIYSAADRVTLILILRGKRLGFTLAESREMIGLYDPESGNTTQLERMLAKLAEKRAQLERQIDDIRQLQTEFDAAEQRVRDALVAAQQAAPGTRKATTPGKKTSSKATSSKTTTSTTTPRPTKTRTTGGKP